MRWPAPPKRLLRISVQLYNSPEQYIRLADALRKELGSGLTIQHLGSPE
jgi:hypothetical protein